MSSKHKGVLSVEYHTGRNRKGALKYRLERRSDEALKFIRTYTNNHQLSMLDIGTADGLMLEKFARELNLKISIGIDFSSELLRFARYDQSYFVQSDISRLPFKDEFFDIVVACAVIEHVSNVGMMFDECNRVLKKGGLCIITTPDPVFERIATKIGYLKEEEHNETFNLEELKSLLEYHEFDILCLEKFMMSPIGFPYELTIEKIMKSVGLQFLLLNQLAVGRKL